MFAVLVSLLLTVGPFCSNAFVTRYRQGYARQVYSGGHTPYSLAYSTPTRALHSLGPGYYTGHADYSSYRQVYAAPVAHVNSPAPVALSKTTVQPVVEAEPLQLAPALPIASTGGVLEAVPAVPELYHAVQDQLDSQANAVVVTAAHSVPVAAPAVHHATVAGPVQVTSDADSFQFHAQDELGNAEYGYSNENSAKHETTSADGFVRGTYSYLDEAGHHTINYVADDWGFRLV